MSWLKQRLADRRHAQEQAVIAAIGMLRPSRASGYPIARLAHIGVVRTFAVLQRLVDAGVLTSEWTDTATPCRVYRVVRSEVAR